MGTDVCRDPDAVDAPRQLIHPPIDKVDHAAEQIGASVRLGRRSLGGGTCEARYDQFTAMCLALIISIRPAMKLETADDRGTRPGSTSAAACCREDRPYHDPSRTLKPSSPM